MSTNNYPPGVTGRELEIAGPDSEYEAVRTCDATYSATIPQGGVYSDSSIMEDVEVECGFTGEVACWTYDGAEHWECPNCETEHVVDLEPDWDAQYDAWKERDL